MDFYGKECTIEKGVSREKTLKVIFENIGVDYGVADKLISMGYCAAPASRSHHGNTEGGLFDHSVAVASVLIDYCTDLRLKFKKRRSPILVGLLHDLCKLDEYIRVDDAWNHDGVTTKYHYEYRNDRLLKGHGELSVIRALQLVPDLTEEEILCIMYHMGPYNTDDWNEFDRAIKKYPTVLYTHMADMHASKIMRR